MALASTIQGRGYYTNVPLTRREGVDAAAAWMGDGWSLHGSASYLDATYRFTGALASPNNPSADAAGNVTVRVGNHLPLNPAWQARLGGDWEILPGLTLGADPVATSMLHAAAAAGERLDAFVVRKAGKAHGLQQRIEGPSIQARHVLVVEDTTTTGNSPLEAIRAVREAGATPVAVATIADRATGAGERIRGEAGVEYRHAYSLDDLGLGTIKETQRNDLLEVLEDRYGRASTVVTSQLPLKKWHEWIGDPTTADAILDRLVHNAYKLELAGPSGRKERGTEKH